MILNPGILALIGGSAVVLLMFLLAAVLGGSILRRWDFTSSSAYQLSLERKTYLISTIMNYVLGFQIVSAVLFIYTVDDIHILFVGAMCATGSLNANPPGWYALLSKIVVLFLSGFWIALNYVDQQVEDYPLVKLKHSLLIVMLPVIAFDLYLQVYYFLGLNPDIITSCCGSLFDEDGTGVVSGMAGLPVKETMVAFYTVVISFFCISGFCLCSKRGVLRLLQSGCSLIVLVVSIAAIISFVSIYIYELPTHHCPFDILQRHYHFIGYPLYLSLFCGAFFGMLPGLFQPVMRFVSLRETISACERKWMLWSMLSISFFVTLVTLAINFNELDLSGY